MRLLAVAAAVAAGASASVAAGSSAARASALTSSSSGTSASALRAAALLLVGDTSLDDDEDNLRAKLTLEEKEFHVDKARLEAVVAAARKEAEAARLNASDAAQALVEVQNEKHTLEAKLNAASVAERKRAEAAAAKTKDEMIAVGRRVEKQEDEIDSAQARGRSAEKLAAAAEATAQHDEAELAAEKAALSTAVAKAEEATRAQAAAEAGAAKMAESMKGAAAMLQTHESSLESSNEHLKEELVSLRRKVREALDAASDAQDAAERDSAAAKKAAQERDATAKQLAAAEHSALRASVDFSTEGAKLRAEESDLQAHLQQVRGLKDAQTDRASSLARDVSAAQRRLEEAETKLKASSARVHELEVQAGSAVAEACSATKRVAELEDRALAAESKAQTESDDLAEAKKAAAEAEAAKRTVALQLTKARAKLESDESASHLVWLRSQEALATAQKASAEAKVKQVSAEGKVWLLEQRLRQQAAQMDKLHVHARSIDAPPANSPTKQHGSVLTAYLQAKPVAKPVVASAGAKPAAGEGSPAVAASKSNEKAPARLVLLDPSKSDNEKHAEWRKQALARLRAVRSRRQQALSRA